MMITLKTKIRLRNSQASPTIYFRIGDDWFSTGIYIDIEAWEPNYEIIKPTCRDYDVINPQYVALKLRAQQFVANLNFTQGIYDKDEFRAYVFQRQVIKKETDPVFTKLVKEYADTKQIGISRWKMYQTLCDHIEATSPQVRLSGVDFRFIERFKKVLTSLDNCENTIARKIKAVKAVIHYCQDCGMISGDPLAKVKVKAIRGNKKFLTKEELQKLEEVYKYQILPDNLKNVLRYFLFSCYTGLRYSDVAKLKCNEIISGSVRTQQEKTGKPVMVPLISQARELLEKYDGYCFHVLSNQHTNAYLKRIMKLAGIQKSISYHCSRHTFATISITLGIPLEVVCELMGIDMATAKVYAKVVEEVKIEAMAKWESLPALKAV